MSAIPVRVTLICEDEKWIAWLAADTILELQIITLAQSTNGVCMARLEENSQTLVITLTSYSDTVHTAKIRVGKIARSLGFRIVGSITSQP